MTKSKYQFPISLDLCYLAYCVLIELFCLTGQTQFVSLPGTIKLISTTNDVVVVDVLAEFQVLQNYFEKSACLMQSQ